MKRCLDLCAEQNLCSVAFPVIGPGTVLEYPLREAIQVLTENICQFGSSASSGSLSAIHIVIESGYPDSEEVTTNSCTAAVNGFPLRRMHAGFLENVFNEGVSDYSATMKSIGTSV